MLSSFSPNTRYPPEEDLSFYVNETHRTLNVFYTSVHSEKERERSMPYKTSDNVLLIVYTTLDRFESKLRGKRGDRPHDWLDIALQYTIDFKVESSSTSLSYFSTDIYTTTLKDLMIHLKGNESIYMDITRVELPSTSQLILCSWKKAWEHLITEKRDFSFEWLRLFLERNVVAKQRKVKGKGDSKVGKTKRNSNKMSDVNDEEDDDEEIKENTTSSSSSSSSSSMDMDMSSSSSSPSPSPSSNPTFSNTMLIKRNRVEEDGDENRVSQKVKSSYFSSPPSSLANSVVKVISLLPYNQVCIGNKMLDFIIGQNANRLDLINLLFPYLDNKDNAHLLSTSKQIGAMIPVEKRPGIISGDSNHYIHLSHWMMLAIACPGMLYLFKKVWYKARTEERDLPFKFLIFQQKLFPFFAQFVQSLLIVRTKKFDLRSPNPFTELILKSKNNIKELSFDGFISIQNEDRIKSYNTDFENRSGLHRIPFFEDHEHDAISTAFLSPFIQSRFLNLRKLYIPSSTLTQGTCDLLNIFIQSPHCRVLFVDFFIEMDSDPRFIIGTKKKIHKLCQNIQTSTLKEVVMGLHNLHDPNLVLEMPKATEAYKECTIYCNDQLSSAFINSNITYIQVNTDSPHLLCSSLESLESRLHHLHFVFNDSFGVNYSAPSFILSIERLQKAIACHPYLHTLHFDVEVIALWKVFMEKSSLFLFHGITRLKIPNYYYMANRNEREQKDSSVIESTNYLSQYPNLQYLETSAEVWRNDLNFIEKEEKPNYILSLMKLLEHLLFKPKLKTLVIRFDAHNYADSSTVPIFKSIFNYLKNVMKNGPKREVEELIFVFSQSGISRKMEDMEEYDMMRQSQVGEYRSKIIESDDKSLDFIRFALKKREMHSLNDYLDSYKFKSPYNDTMNISRVMTDFDNSVITRDIF